MKILTKFLMRRYLRGVALVMLVVCGIIFAITFVERLPSNATVFLAASDAWTRLLEYMPMFLPLAVFMGTLLAGYGLTKSTESIIVSGAGLSPYQSTRPFLNAAAIVGILATLIVNPYSVNLSSRNITADKLNLVGDAVWLREESDAGLITLRAENMRRTGDTLGFGRATVLRQSPDFKLVQRVESDMIVLSDTGLAAQSAKIWDAGGNMKSGTWAANTRLNPKTVLDRYLQPSQISFWEYPSFIKKMKSVGAPVQPHLVQFWTLLFMPLTLIAMTVLGVAFSQTRQRRNYSFGIKFGIGIITCFAVYFITNLMGAAAALGSLPAFLAVIAPPLIIIAGAGTFIATFDTV